MQSFLISSFIFFADAGFAIIYGSYSRFSATKESDIDILIQVRKRKKFSLIDLVGLEQELEEKLKKKVDLLTYNGINHLLKNIILNEEVRII